MNKFILLGVFFWLPLSASGEANIETKDASKTFLLTAPGTLTGRVPGDKPDVNEQIAPRPATTIQQPLRYKPGRYKKGGESYKFPQYGQVYGRYNPWSERESNRQLPPPLPPASPNYSNPWDLSGRLPAQTGGHPSNPYFYNPAPNRGLYGYSPNLNPDFPGGIYRDTNPANTMPLFNGMMPGLGADNNGFPFSPFGMF